MDVDLTWGEATIAGHVGLLRQIKALQHGRTERYGRAANPWASHIEGAAGEYVVARALDRHWSGALNPNGVDVGPVEVRTRGGSDYDLVIRPKDADDTPVVLVTGRIPRFRIAGWILAGDAKRAEWWRSYDGRPPYFYVPQAALKPLESLAGVV